MYDGRISFLNYAERQDGTAIATKLYYEELVRNGKNVDWIQLSDYYHPEKYLNSGILVPGSKLPIRGARVGFDRLIYFPRQLRKLKLSRALFLADPSLIRIGLKHGDFMIKVHDLIPITKYSESRFYTAMVNYAIPRLKLAKKIIVTTNYMKSLISPYVEEKDDIHVVTEPVNISLDSNRAKRHLSKTDKKSQFNVTYIAADRPYKNLKFFIDLADYFQQKNIANYRFLLVSRLRPETLEYLKSLKLKNLTVLSNLSDISEIYYDTDIFVNVSLQEGFGRPNVEAMAFGIPIVAGKTEPFKEILGEVGTFAEEGNLENWFENIMKVSEPENYNRLSNLALTRFRNFYSYDVFSHQLAKAFDSFLECLDLE